MVAWHHAEIVSSKQRIQIIAAMRLVQALALYQARVPLVV